MGVYIAMTICSVFFSALANINTYEKKRYTINIKLLFWYLSEIVLIIVAAITYNLVQHHI